LKRKGRLVKYKKILGGTGELGDLSSLKFKKTFSRDNLLHWKYDVKGPFLTGLEGRAGFIIEGMASRCICVGKKLLSTLGKERLT